MALKNWVFSLETKGTYNEYFMIKKAISICSRTWTYFTHLLVIITYILKRMKLMEVYLCRKLIKGSSLASWCESFFIVYKSSPTDWKWSSVKCRCDDFLPTDESSWWRIWITEKSSPVDDERMTALIDWKFSWKCLSFHKLS